MVKTLRPTLSENATLGQILLERAALPHREWDVRLLLVTEELPPGFELEGPDRGLPLTTTQVLTMARKAAARLARHGVISGTRVVLMLSTGPGFLAAFFGCALLGAIPVPVAPPWSSDRLGAHSRRIANIIRTCDTDFVVTESRFSKLLLRENGESPLGSVQWIMSLDLLTEDELWTAPPPTDAQAAAFIQFTSGSISDPKGVVVSHRALFENCRFIADSMDTYTEDASCSWLPLFHDMGLVGCLLCPLATDFAAVLLPSDAFMLKPLVWLEAISRYRTNFSPAPNFSYELCVNRIREQELTGLNLESWRVALSGAEPVLASTVRRFSERFAPVGFKASSWSPVYGLAETTLAASMPKPGLGLRIDRIQRSTLEATGQAVIAPDEEDALEVVCVGAADYKHEIRITGPDGCVLEDRRVGSIEVSGPSVMKGYFRAPEATRSALDGGWLKTGDLGYLVRGELFVTGRQKELIIRGGRNYYPYDIELAAAKVPGVRGDRVVAVGIPNPQSGTDDLVLVCETRVKAPAERQALELAILTHVFGETGVRPDVVRLVGPNTLTRTSSGKMQRALVRARLLDGTLDSA